MTYLLAKVEGQRHSVGSKDRVETNGQTEAIALPAALMSSGIAQIPVVLFCSVAVLDRRVAHTMDVLSPFTSILCHSD